MLGEILDTAMKPIVRFLQYNYDAKPMQPLGVNNTMKLARAYNRLKYGRYLEFRKNQYLHHFDELIRENGLPVSTPNEIKDGWALDTSGKLPHLQELLKNAEEIIKERGGVKRTDFGRPYFQEIPIDDLLVKYPSILDFGTSSDILSTVCNYLGFIPTLSAALPPGIRFNESWAKHESTPNVPFRSSQLFHLDYHDSPMAYALVLVREGNMENGPFCILPESVSKKASEALDYRTRGRRHRVTDE